MPAGVYIHIPFCKSRCSYCDFATDVYQNGDAVRRYATAMDKEISNFKFPTADTGSERIDTIYFGGGTPSLLLPVQVERILKSVFAKFSVATRAEITMEMNPATVTPETLSAFRSLGVNRASFGVQTFNDRSLKLLARGHDADDARKTFAMLREVGFDNVSFDLIAGLPGQTLDDWRRNLDEAIALSPEHISLYLLEIHTGTPLAEQVQTGRQPVPDDDVAAEMYELMLDRVAEAGYMQYEISNFCKVGFESQHNTKYWRLDPVYGFGVSAHSFDGRERYANERDTRGYVTAIERGESAEVSREAVNPASEAAFLGLRMESGIEIDEFQRRFDLNITEKYREELGEVTTAGLVELSDGWLKLTKKGKLLSNEVFAIFV